MKTSSLFSPLADPARLISLLLTSACLTLALQWTIATLPAQSHEAPTAAKPASILTTQINKAVATRSTALPDGTYLYGQVAKPNQIGRTYLVFQSKQNQLVGAFYMPSSSFDCLQGELKQERLLLTVTDSYEQKTHPYTIAVQTSATATATASGSGLPELAGYHLIGTIAPNDYRMLEACKATLGSVAR